MVSDISPAAPSSIRELRAAARLSQEQVARRANCSTASVRLLEGGWQPKHSEVRQRVLAVLKASVAPSALVDRRKLLGLSQEQVGRRANLDQRVVAGVESGEVAPDRTTQEQLASALSTSVDVLFPRRPSA